MPSDSELLLSFARSADEQAFAEVVSRYSNLVFGAALRRLRDQTMAEHVTQNVFTILAKKSAQLYKHPTLAAWLHKTAAYESMRAAEKESNHRRHLEEFRQSQDDYEIQIAIEIPVRGRIADTVVV